MLISYAKRKKIMHFSVRKLYNIKHSFKYKVWDMLNYIWIVRNNKRTSQVSSHICKILKKQIKFTFFNLFSYISCICIDVVILISFKTSVETLIFALYGRYPLKEDQMCDKENFHNMFHVCSNH
jgi:hypothetical protein